MNIVFLHGLNSTCTTFNFMLDRLKLTEHRVFKINYDSHARVKDILDEVRPKLPKGKFAIIGHSLGGVIAALIAEEFHDRVLKLVTISSPLKGAVAATYLMLVPGHLRIMEDLAPMSSVMRHLSELTLAVPTLSFVSTQGHLPVIPIFDEPNDGLVSIRSQKGLQFARQLEIPANHFEILMHDGAVSTLQQFLNV